MKTLYTVEYVIQDGGFAYPVMEKELPAKSLDDVNNALKKYLNKARYSLQISTKFTFEIKSVKITGYIV